MQLGGGFALAILLALALTARAGEVEEERRINDLAFNLMLEGQTRIMGVADRIRIAGAELCGTNVAPVIGVFSADNETIDDMWRDKDYVAPFIEAGIERYKLGREPKVLAVVPGLPAAEAGLQAGDVVTAVDGEKVKERVYLDVLRNHGEQGVVRLEVDREGARHTLALKVRMGCAVPSRFRFGAEINAFAASFGNVTGVYFYSGLLRYFPDDDQLAIVAGHELAHHMLGHTNQPRTFERTEAEADYLGLYFAARAGFDVSAAESVWDGFGRSSPYSSVRWGFYSHPASAKRSLEQRATLEEIAGKLQRSEPLEPEKGRLALKRPNVDPEQLDIHLAELRKDALRIFRANQDRIQMVSYRLVSQGTPVCGEHVSPVLGATVGRAQDFFLGLGKRDEVEAAFGVGRDVAVFAIAKGSPAQQAGLQVGDRIAEVDGKAISRSEHVFEQLRSSRSGPIALSVVRGEQTLSLSLPRVIGCQFGTMTLPDSQASTHYHANRKEFIVFTGLVRFVRDDDELAIAISHQLGHQLIGRFRSAKDEPRADELGLRIAAKAGYDVRKAPAFWDRWAAEQFWTISSEMDDTFIPHGAMSWRAPVIRETLIGIEAERPSDD